LLLQHEKERIALPLVEPLEHGIQVKAAWA
jgi:hypothetical protein